jgi:hypothetical protein
LGVFSSLSSLSREKLSVGGFWNRQTFTVRHWTKSRWYIWVLHCPIFLLGNPFMDRRHHTEVAVCEVICRLPSYHGHCKWHGTCFGIQPSVELWWTGCAAHVQSPALVLIACFTTKVQEVGSFIIGVKAHFFETNVESPHI